MDIKHILEQEDLVIATKRPEKKLHPEVRSEEEIEVFLINNLKNLGYEYAENIKNLDALKINLRERMNELNKDDLQKRPRPDGNWELSDREWQIFCDEYLLNKKHRSIEKTRLLQEPGAHRYTLTRDGDKIEVNLKIIDKDNWAKNTLQVINQFNVITEDGIKNRYDVTILVNGLPLCHIELKRRGWKLEDAFNQIKRYWDVSLQETDGLFDYVQLFVISNWTDTRYYSNTVRDNNWRKNTDTKRNKEYHSYKQTSHWADLENEKIDDLEGFTNTFLTKNVLINVLTKYCVFNSNEELLVMRPYQIAAVEKIMSKVECAINNTDYLGKDQSRGYVWHTTGSGKTLTSFKTAQLISSIYKFHKVYKVVFVVDRMDLNHQTQREYNKFQEGAASNASSVRTLDKLFKNQDKSEKIIVTTIQKLTRLINSYNSPKRKDYDETLDNEKLHGEELRHKIIVFIFDECHRSQFGKMHSAISKYFKKSMMFGFTGTPIFEKNSNISLDGHKLTTAHLFGNRQEPLHIYTIEHAWKDDKVLKLKHHTVGKFVKSDEIRDGDKKTTPLIDVRPVFEGYEKIKDITTYILDNFDKYTLRLKNSNYYDTRWKLVEKYGYEQFESYRSQLPGFNSMLAASSIDAAKLYYSYFKESQKECDVKNKLNVAIVYNYANKEMGSDDEVDKNLVAYDSHANTDLGDENPEELDHNMKSDDKEFLENAIKDYNKLFDTSYEIHDLKSYYNDVSRRTKNGSIDILIVVNMMLTGFDAPQLNTIWIDKNLKDHGLIQAFSRVNRVFDKTKPYGNVVCFRNIKKAAREAFALFRVKETDNYLELKGFDAYYYGDEITEGYKVIVEKLRDKFPFDSLRDIKLKEEKKDFMKTFNKWLRAHRFLYAFDEFKDDKVILEQAEIDDYKGYYLSFKEQLNEFIKLEDISDAVTYKIDDFDINYEAELFKAHDYDLDHIDNLIYSEIKNKTKGVIKEKDKSEFAKYLWDQIKKPTYSSSFLRTRKELIESFIMYANFDPDLIKQSSDVGDQFIRYVKQTIDDRLEKIAKKYEMEIKKLTDYFNGCIKDDEPPRRGRGFSSLFVSGSPWAPLPKLRDEYNKKRELEDKAFNELTDLFIETNLSN
ncbi:type I restriction endonuclease subunit R [Mycoplasma tullyi]|uniref:Type I restriction enzyme endonuclease subunit n=1 Tax=Mycoplasma tullyi TaxID=1612150 RepID=A0A7D7U581_9MOLU|nr:type I restriction endonuclease subunit R [Mycoplasma tullyi]QMT98308.1 type I restriction endonuclease subunit R [Mycoplasma tullyi]